MAGGDPSTGSQPKGRIQEIDEDDLQETRRASRPRESVTSASKASVKRSQDRQERGSSQEDSDTSSSPSLSTSDSDESTSLAECSAKLAKAQTLSKCQYPTSRVASSKSTRKATALAETPAPAQMPAREAKIARRLAQTARRIEAKRTAAEAKTQAAAQIGAAVMLMTHAAGKRPTCRIEDVVVEHYGTSYNADCQEGTESNGYRGTGPGERIGSVNGWSSHHRVVSGQLHDAQIPTTDQPTARRRAARQIHFPIGPHQTVRKATESNGYRATGPDERVGSVNERSSHHRVVSGQLHDAQTSTPRPRTSMEKLRKPFLTHLTHSVHRLPGSFIRDFFLRALRMLLLTHSPYTYYNHTVHMNHLGRSGTLLDPPNTQVSNPHATALYCRLAELTEIMYWFSSRRLDRARHLLNRHGLRRSVR